MTKFLAMIAAVLMVTAAYADKMPRDRVQVGALCLVPQARTEAHVKDIKNCGIDFMYGVPANDRQTLDLFAKYDMGVIATGGVPFWHGMAGEQAGQMRELRPLLAYEDALKKIKYHPAMWYLDFVDEPSALDYAAIGETCNLIAKANPEVPAYINLYPCYARTADNSSGNKNSQLGVATYEEYISQYCREIPLDYISFDYYIYSAKPDGRKIMDNNFHRNMKCVADACRDSGRSLWFMAQVNSRFRGQPLSEDQLRFQAFASMAYGAEIIEWACWSWSGGDESPDMPGLCGWWEHNVLDREKGYAKSEQYDKLKHVNAEIHALGEDFMKFRRVDTKLQKGGEQFGNGWFTGVAAEDEKELLIGDLAPRKQVDGPHALWLFAANDPFCLEPPTNRVVRFKTAGKVTVKSVFGKVDCCPSADGYYRVTLKNKLPLLVIADLNPKANTHCALVKPSRMSKVNSKIAGSINEIHSLAKQLLDGLGVEFDPLDDTKLEDAQLAHIRVLFLCKGDQLSPEAQPAVDRFKARGGIVIAVRHHELFQRRLFMAQMAKEAAADKQFWDEVFARNQRQHERELIALSAVPSKPGEVHRTSFHNFPWRPVIDGREVSFDEAVAYMKRLGFNVLTSWSHSPNVAHYRSKVLPVDPLVNERGDMLDEFIAACRKHGVKSCASLRCCSANGKQNFGDFQKWIEQDGRGSIRRDGTLNPKAICPAHPLNRQLLIDAALEMAERGADVVDLDYIRFYDANNCFCERCKAGIAACDGKVNEYRAKTIYSLVREIRTALRESFPKVKLGISPFPTIDAEAADRGQAWDTWCRDGLLDEVYPMDYWRSPEALFGLYQRQNAYLHGVPSYPCIGPILWADDFHREIRMARIIEKVREAGLPGFSYFTVDPREMELLNNLAKGPLQ